MFNALVLCCADIAHIIKKQTTRLEVRVSVTSHYIDIVHGALDIDC